MKIFKLLIFYALCYMDILQTRPCAHLPSSASAIITFTSSCRRFTKLNAKLKMCCYNFRLVSINSLKIDTIKAEKLVRLKLTFSNYAFIRIY